MEAFYANAVQPVACGLIAYANKNLTFTCSVYCRSLKIFMPSVHKVLASCSSYISHY